MQRRKSLSDISSLKSHRNGKGPPPADLLACFPPRNPQYSVKRLTAPPAAASHRQRKSYDSNHDDEPTSPKVTCAGQIKLKSKPKSWHSVMQDIERIHIKKPSATQLLSTCLRNFRFDFRCFGSIHEITSDDEDGDEEEEEDCDHAEEYNDPFVVDRGKMMDGGDVAPPPNALLLMRSRSAPLKRWLLEEEKEKERREAERLVVMRCGDDFSKLSDDIAKETWIGEGIADILARSRSWKR